MKILKFRKKQFYIFAIGSKLLNGNIDSSYINRCLLNLTKTKILRLFERR